MGATLMALRDMEYVSVEEAEARSLAEIRALNRERGLGEPRIPEMPMGQNYLKWRAFVALLDPSAGDRLRWRVVRRAGHRVRAGFQLVRGVTIRASYVVPMG